MDLVENDETVEPFKRSFRRLQAPEIDRVFEVEERRRLLLCQDPCEGRFATLTGAKECAHGVDSEGLSHLLEILGTLDHGEQ